jgi:UPF0176 protein
MYCTGGIRCEKASAYIRQTTNTKEVLHLKGGILKYLEVYDGHGDDDDGEEESLFLGKNFVFDRRGTATASESKRGAGVVGNSKVVGKCLSCNGPWDTFTLDGVCSVCREPVLTCPSCRSTNPHPGEYHCSDHAYLYDNATLPIGHILHWRNYKVKSRSFGM